MSNALRVSIVGKSRTDKAIRGFASSFLMTLLASGCGSTQPKSEEAAEAGETLAPVDTPVPVAKRDPNPADPAYRWDLTPLYASDEAFAKAMKDVQAQLPEIEASAGTLGKNASSLLKALDTIFGIAKEVYRLLFYAYGRFNEDTRNALGLEMKQSAMQLDAEYHEKVAFFEPEILEIGRRKAVLLGRRPRPYAHGMYEYATSLAASSQFVKEVLEGKEGARERYLEMLKAGGSQYSYEIQKAAGVDLATPAPYLAIITRMNDIMDQMERTIGE